MYKFNAAGALCLVFDDEEAGQVCDDEFPDEVKISEVDFLADNVFDDETSKC